MSSRSQIFYVQRTIRTSPEQTREQYLESDGFGWSWVSDRHDATPFPYLIQAEYARDFVKKHPEPGDDVICHQIITVS